ncbi:hypothetical protein IV203_010816 [Nitzschia inconspicua]|uniref:Uncharacterized protein n=1 Tax=Nitzschia inconspicua TaxID=303405 RepID=A0A9K3KXJ1_9STRA|nr:hypothetical protein IV203_010816 [Nitzschia inconspicua]
MISHTRVDIVDAFGMSVTTRPFSRTVSSSSSSTSTTTKHPSIALYGSRENNNNNNNNINPEKSINGDLISETSATTPITMDQLMPDESIQEALQNAVNKTIVFEHQEEGKEGEKHDTDETESSSSLVSSDLNRSLSESSSLSSSSRLEELSDLSPNYPFAPPLTYNKFLTMQSKRVMVSIRYSAESGLKKFFLTAAKRIKDMFPDVILERVILPKVDVGESGFDAKSAFAGSVFEILVDGKVVFRTAPGRKGTQSNEMTVFVSMQELDAAISRARRRRRPSTVVYGEEDDLDDDKSRLQVLKDKAYEINLKKAAQLKKK